jgi:hypothetical protein
LKETHSAINGKASEINGSIGATDEECGNSFE